MERQWRVYAKKADFQALGTKLNVDPVVVRLLRNREIGTEQEMEFFLYGGLNRVHDPILMKDMDKGTDIMCRKIAEHKKIRIVGDYDVDGVMATYILFTALQKTGADVTYEIPHRIWDGYGINERIIRKAVSDGVDTIITCDNGIASVAALHIAKEAGLTVIVTDHHEAQKETVEADAIIDIKQKDCAYPFKQLCGAAVAYKFIQCLYRKMNLPLASDDYLEYIAIATVCDVMDLTDENRIYVREGLKKLQRTDNIGLRALLRVKELEDKDHLTTYHLGFVIGPCINSAGRLESANAALELLFCRDMAEAEIIAGKLADLNEERKNLMNQGMEAALRIVEEQNMTTDHVLVVHVPKLHESLAGLVAGKLREAYYLPVIVLTDSDAEPDIVKGSARSIEGFNIFEALQECKEYLEKFGGHALAAGLSLKRENINALRQTLNENEHMTEDVLAPKLHIDVPMPMSYVYPELIQQIDALEPFGKGNEDPVFAEADMRVSSARILGKNQNVLKLKLINGEGRYFEGIYFDPQEFLNHIKEWFNEEECDKMLNGLENSVRLDIAYRPQLNQYMGNSTIQFKLLDYRKA